VSSCSTTCHSRSNSSRSAARWIWSSILYGAAGASLLGCLKRGGRYVNVDAAAGDGAPFHVELLRASQLTIIDFSGASANPVDVIASYQRVADLSAAGSLTLPTAIYPLDEAAQAWQAQASSPGQKIVLVP
jgi:NADPH:quinone reductase-like Zn-dependent oxidoreductase